MKRTLVLLSISMASLSCDREQIDSKSEGEKLMQLSREWSKSASTDSLERTLSYWADDAVVLPPGQAPIKGKNAIREMIKETAKIPGFQISWEPLSVEISKSGDMAYMLEQNKVNINDSSGKQITQYNKGVTVWKRQPDGSWKNVVDTWNAAPPR